MVLAPERDLTTLKLQDTTTFSTGIVVLVYSS
jgi:hypothetical protein